MATLSQMMNPQMMQMMQQAMQRGGGGGGMMRQGGGMNPMARPTNGQQGVPQNYGGGGMMRQAAPSPMAQQQPMGGNPQAQMMQQMAQRFGQPATTPQFDPRAYAAQQQQAQQQRWAQLMQQLGRSPQGVTNPRLPGASTPARTTAEEQALQDAIFAFKKDERGYSDMNPYIG